MGNSDPPFEYQVPDVQFRFACPLFHGQTQFGRVFRCGFLVVALGLCSAALHGLGEAGGFRFKGVQALKEEAHLEGNIEVVVLGDCLEG